MMHISEWLKNGEPATTVSIVRNYELEDKPAEDGLFSMARLIILAAENYFEGRQFEFEKDYTFIFPTSYFFEYDSRYFVATFISPTIIQVGANIKVQ